MSEANHNPLIAPLLVLLQQAHGRYKVHELMAALRQQGAIPLLADDEQLQLFRVNFLIMNALYQLQAELHDAGWWLVISSLDIRLEPLADTPEASHAFTIGENLRSYYLDWQVCWQTDRAEVEALLNRFWRAYDGEGHKEEALALLELNEGASQEAIRHRWRELALQHHPDRGGNAETFIRIRWAWECLRG
jgi:DnaJ-domain-containing protein 1